MAASRTAHSRTYRNCCAAATCWSSTDRKSTRLNSSHSQISYAVFCLKKKKHTLDALKPRAGTQHTHFVLFYLIVVDGDSVPAPHSYSVAQVPVSAHLVSLRVMQRAT